ncbi:PspA/IM30 family protein [Roseovarius faecimaris]|uniref:PspA/IM30 family protein n=1 Tax=Roseovarius faecimaris TaxID=2494550 RepID=A0A6I6IWW3_9RHOB|nr:PspA/IM30 family protein [Roseovarius faecimaris]QGX99907.1 PspA/IM30 family protein [Roseovarius faecimaris]
MFEILRTLTIGANARAEDRLKDAFAIELIDQKIRDSEAQLKAAKGTLASLVQRQRSEARLLEALTTRIRTMTNRASEAIAAGRDDMALQAAEAIATMENEARLRHGTVDRLEEKVTRLRSSVEAAHRRLIDLKQGAVTARAIKREQLMQGRLRTTIANTAAADEAEELIARVVGRDDPFEQSQILAGIEADLNHSSLDDRMAAEGFGPASKVTASQVLARLKKT